MTFAATLERHREGILAYYDVPISTGPLEGTNNKIKTLQRTAYGFRDPEFFKLRIYAYTRAATPSWVELTTGPPPGEGKLAKFTVTIAPTRGIAIIDID